MTNRNLRLRGAGTFVLAVCVAMPPAGGPFASGLQDAEPPQRQPRPTRDAARAEPDGTAIIRGRIVVAESGSPVRRAVVRATAPGLRGGRATTTDADGVYELRQLPTGRYRITASKPGYLQVTFGQRQPRGPSTAIELADGQVRDHIDFSLQRGGVITGRVVDELGEPVMDAMLMAITDLQAAGTRRLSSVGRQALTNDLGQFRLFGLPPGDYYLVATLRPGRGVEYPDDQGYGPTFHPNATSVSQAQRVRIGAGGEQAGIDIQMMPVRTATVEGVALDSLGQPLTAGLAMLRPSGLDLRMPMFQGLGGRVESSGAFAVRNVPPGDYVLVVSSRPGFGGGMGRNRRRPGINPEAGSEAPEVATVPLTVAGQDLSGLTVVTDRGATASGRLVAAAGDPTDVSSARLRVTATGGDLEDGFLTRGGSTAVLPDWTFAVTGLRGSLYFQVDGLPEGWGVEQIRFGSADISDSGLAFDGPGEARDVEIVITNRLTRLQAAVRNDVGEPAEEFAFVLFATDAERWAPPSRYVRVGNGSKGRFAVSGLPPGDYYAVAVDSFGDVDPQDPEALDRLSQLATRVVLVGDDPRSVELTTVGVPEP